MSDGTDWPDLGYSPDDMVGIADNGTQTLDHAHTLIEKVRRHGNSHADAKALQAAQEFIESAQADFQIHKDIAEKLAEPAESAAQEAER